MSLHWIGHGLPCRPTSRAEAYGLFACKAGELPPLQDREIERFSQFASVADLAAAQISDTLPSIGPYPVGMEWVPNIAASDAFLYDPAYDLIWSEKNGTVYCCGLVVAHSLPEFFARLMVESDIWRRLLDSDIQDFCQAQTRNPRAIDRMWQSLPLTMPPRLIEYLEWLRAARQSAYIRTRYISNA